MLRERINQFFGYGALTRIILKHGLKGSHVLTPPKPAQPDESRQALVQSLISDLPDHLKESLEMIGLRVK